MEEEHREEDLKISTQPEIDLSMTSQFFSTKKIFLFVCLLLIGMIFLIFGVINFFTEQNKKKKQHGTAIFFILLGSLFFFPSMYFLFTILQYHRAGSAQERAEILKEVEMS